MNPIENIHSVAVIGAGSWGTAVARAIGETHPRLSLRMWALEKDVALSINTRHVNERYLPGVLLPPSLTATVSLRDAIADADAVLLATPSKAVYDISRKIAPDLKPGAPLGYLSKGFCKIQGEIYTISQTIEMAIPSLRGRVVAVSGPSHAEEVSRNYHTCLNIGGQDPTDRAVFSSLINCGYLQCRECDDVIGVELGGTLKNPAAIAAGMISVLPGCGDNLAGALMSEALKEMIALGSIFDVKPSTMIDISGLGDLVATALSDHSRNRRFGRDIAARLLRGGKTLSLIDLFLIRVRPRSVIGRMSEKLNYLAEGAYAIEPLIELAQSAGVAIPVYRSLYEVLMNKKDPSLLVETIKDPARFEELYSRTPIHLTGRRKGLEGLRGNAFAGIIVGKTIEKFSPAVSSDGQDRRLLMEGLSGSLSPACGARDRECRKELALTKRLAEGNFGEGLRELVEHYVDMITDRFSPVISVLLYIYAVLCLFVNRLRGREGSVEVKGDVGGLRKARKSANIIYLAPRGGALDFLYYLLAIRKKGLPFPRFFIPSEAVTGPRARWLARRAGGFIVDEARLANPVYRETLSQYLSAMISHGVPILYFPTFREGEGHDPAGHELYSKVIEALYAHTVEIIAVPLSVEFITGGKTGRIAGVNLLEGLSGDAAVAFSSPVRLSEFTRNPEMLNTVPAVVARSWRPVREDGR